MRGKRAKALRRYEEDIAAQALASGAQMIPDRGYYKDTKGIIRLTERCRRRSYKLIKKAARQSL